MDEEDETKRKLMKLTPKMRGLLVWGCWTLVIGPVLGPGPKAEVKQVSVTCCHFSSRTKDFFLFFFVN